jgi:hypothetical protein
MLGDSRLGGGDRAVLGRDRAELGGCRPNFQVVRREGRLMLTLLVLVIIADIQTPSVACGLANAFTKAGVMYTMSASG